MSFQRYEVPAFLSRGGGRDVWIAARASELIRQLMGRGLSWGMAASITPAFLAQFWRETAAGTAEHNFNIANMKPSNAHPAAGEEGWDGAFYYAYDGPNKSWFRSFPDLRAAVADYLWLLERQRYRGAWLYLLSTSDPGGWYTRFMDAGYNPRAPGDLAEYNGYVRRLGGPRPDLRNVQEF